MASLSIFYCFSILHGLASLSISYRHKFLGQGAQAKAHNTLLILARTLSDKV